MIAITRVALPVALMIALTACAQIDPDPEIHLSAVPDEGSISGGTDSLVADLALGMNAVQVAAAIGESQANIVSPSEVDVTCRSYVYDETNAPKFAHVWFRDDQLVQATDGNLGLCVLN